METKAQEIEYSDYPYECHYCGDIKKVWIIPIPYLCQHSLNICPECLLKLVPTLLDLLRKKL
jgi:hypothetical protein